MRLSRLTPVTCGCCRVLLPSHSPEHLVAAWVFFVVLTWVHVWANMRALRCLVLSSLNTPRLKLLLQHYQQKVRLLARVMRNWGCAWARWK